MWPRHICLHLHANTSQWCLAPFLFVNAELPSNQLVPQWRCIYVWGCVFAAQVGSVILVLIHSLFITKLEVSPPGTKPCSLRWWAIVLPLHQLCALYQHLLLELRRHPEDARCSLKAFTVHTWNLRNALARQCVRVLRHLYNGINVGRHYGPKG